MPAECRPVNAQTAFQRVNRPEIGQMNTSAEHRRVKPSPVSAGDNLEFSLQLHRPVITGSRK